MAVLYVLYVTSGSLRSDAAAFLYVLYVRDIRYLLYGYAVGGTSTTRYVYIYIPSIYLLAILLSVVPVLVLGSVFRLLNVLVEVELLCIVCCV